MNRLIIAMLVLALGYFAVDNFVLAPRRAVAPNDSRSTGAKSIAVLPFVNMSSDKEHEYFSDGLSEEFSNPLARIYHAGGAPLRRSHLKGNDAMSRPSPER